MLTFIFSFWTRLSKMGLFKPNRSALVSFMIRIFLLGLTIQDTHVTDCFLHKLNSFLLWVRITGLKKPSNYPLITRLSSSFSKLLILLKCPFLVLQTYVQLVYILEPLHLAFFQPQFGEFLFFRLVCFKIWYFKF